MFDRRIVFWLNFRIIELGSTGITKSNQLGGTWPANLRVWSSQLAHGSLIIKKHLPRSSQNKKKHTSSQALIPGWRWRESPIHDLSCFICITDVPKILTREKIWPGQGKVLQRLLPRLAKRGPRAVPAAPKSCPSRCCASCTVSLAEMRAGCEKSSVLGDGKHG